MPQYSKRTKQWRPVAVLEGKEYKYIPELLVKVFMKRSTATEPVNQRLTMVDDDPRNICPNIATTPRPTLSKLDVM